MSKKTVDVKLKNVYKCYQQTDSQKTKNLLITLFPELNKRIQPHYKNGWVLAEKGDQHKFVKIKGNYVKMGFIIDSNYVEYNKQIRIKNLPIEFLEDIDYFKEEENAE